MSNFASTNVPASMSAMQSNFESVMPAIAKTTEDNSFTIMGALRGIIDLAKEAWKWLTKKELVGNSSIGIGPLGVKLPNKGSGGIVEGPTGAPIPIIAHGGERVVSAQGADVNGSSGGININFYGGVQLDSQQRVEELASRISRMLGRQNELARYGAGY